MGGQDAIQVSYDLQAGTYLDEYKSNRAFFSNYHDEISNIIATYMPTDFSSYTLLEAGVGEGRTLVPILNRLKKKDLYAGGFDISWSRIKYAEKFEQLFSESKRKLSLFVGDLFDIMLQDSSVNMVITVGAIEPNGGREKDAIEELYRITKNVLIMFEPDYNLANDDGKKHMDKHGYIKCLYETAKEMNCKIVEYKLLNNYLNPLNPMSVIFIEKKPFEQDDGVNTFSFINTISGRNMFTKNGILTDGVYHCYPQIMGIPILMKEKAILTTKISDF